MNKLEKILLGMVLSISAICIGIAGYKLLTNKDYKKPLYIAEGALIGSIIYTNLRENRK